MAPLHTSRFLLSVWLLAAVGCSSLPWRGQRDTGSPHQAYPADQESPGLAALPVEGASPSQQSPSPTAQPGDGISTRSAGQTPPQRPQGVGRPQATGIASQQPAVENAAVSISEMTTFIQELEAAPHVDSAARSQILATAFQTPPELQAQLIRQYRALLALGRTNSPAAGRQTPVTMPAAVPLPTEPVVELKAEAVLAAAHTQPIDEPQVAAPDASAAPTDLESQLVTLLREMKTTKVEPAAYTSVKDSSDERPAATRVGNDATWQKLVDSAIEKLEQQKDRRIDSADCEEDEARLRMLYLIADRRDDAVRAIASLEPEMQEFWSKQFFALATLMNPELIADRSNRLIESKRNLDEAVRRLGESAPLFVRNLAFVTEVQSYGAYKPFDEYEFRPGQPVLLYAEVENYRCKETARGYHTALRSSYEIFDSRHQKVAEHEFQTNEEHCRSVRRDFFTICEFNMSDKLYPGKYELRLTVADLNGDKSGESSITFHIRDESDKR